jgi:hypothetical protein
MMSGPGRVRSALRAALVAMAATALAVFALQSPSMAEENYSGLCARADTGCVTGVKVAAPQGDCYTADSESASTGACVVYAGDYVYVKDGQADGRAALASVRDPDGPVLYQLCRNNYGNGTWARCNLDWVESGTQHLSAGFLAADGQILLSNVALWTNN